MMSGQLVGEKILTSTSPKAVGSTDAGKEKEAEAAPAPAQQPQLFVTMNGKIYSLERFQKDFVDVTVKEVDMLNELDVSKLYHCDGLVLCVATDKKKDHEPKLVLWNPYLSQTRWIEPRETFNIQDWHAIGYSSDDSDSQRNHKILRFGLGEKRDKVWYEIYDIKSNTWRVLEVVINNPVWWIDYDQGGVSVKGNAYFLAHHLIDGLYGYKRDEIFLLSFDFTEERFGPRLPLPFHDSFSGYNGGRMFLSSDNNDEQLAVMFGGTESDFVEVWVTLTVDPNGASWTKYLRVQTDPFGRVHLKLCTPHSGGSFFVDEENKVAVMFEMYQLNKVVHKAFVVGQDGYLKSYVNLGEALILENRNPFTNNIQKAARPPLVCSSPYYRPSLVQVDHKRKRMPPSTEEEEIDESRRPIVLVTNGDGIDSPGLVSLVEALVSEGLYDVHVCAPQTCAFSPSKETIAASSVNIKGATAFELSGTPVDCISLGLSGALFAWSKPPVLVISGINQGSSCGNQVSWSQGSFGFWSTLFVNIIELGFKVTKQSTWRKSPSWQAVSAIRHPGAGNFMSNQQSLGAPLAQPGRDFCIWQSQGPPRRFTTQKKSIVEIESVGVKKYFHQEFVAKEQEHTDEDLDIKALEDGFVSVTPLSLLPKMDSETQAAVSEWISKALNSDQ